MVVKMVYSDEGSHENLKRGEEVQLVQVDLFSLITESAVRMGKYYYFFEGKTTFFRRIHKFEE